MGRLSQELEAKWQEGLASSVGEKAEMADAHEAGGKHVEQEPAQELIDIESHRALLVGMRRVSPAKADLAVLEGDQTMIGNRHAVGVAAKITENLFGTPEGRFTVNHPVLAE